MVLKVSNKSIKSFSKHGKITAKMKDTRAKVGDVKLKKRASSLRTIGGGAEPDSGNANLGVKKGIEE